MSEALKQAETHLTNLRLELNDWVSCSTQEQLERWRDIQQEVKRVALKAVDEGDILAVLIRLPSGDLAFNVFGPPSWELIDMLEGAVSQFKRALGLSLPKGRAS